jgi:tetratricopeptide (TPR) repeat protein
MSGLANVYRRQERFEEAEEIFVEVLALRRENFPEEHTLVSEAKSNLGFALVGLGRLDEAEALLLDAYERFLDSRGPEDARTGMTASRLAVLYDDKGDAATAEKYRALSNPE